MHVIMFSLVFMVFFLKAVFMKLCTGLAHALFPLSLRVQGDYGLGSYWGGTESNGLCKRELRNVEKASFE